MYGSETGFSTEFSFIEALNKITAPSADERKGQHTSVSERPLPVLYEGVATRSIGLTDWEACISRLAKLETRMAVLEASKESAGRKAGEEPDATFENKVDSTTNVSQTADVLPRTAEDELQNERLEIVECLHHDTSKQASRTVEPSTWETLLFVNLPCVGPSATCLLYVGVLVNIVLQVLLIAIAMSEFARDKDLGDDAVESARKWRLTDAHSMQTMDVASWTSLASRVCAKDETLIVASRQVDLLKAIRTYLRPAPVPLLSAININVGPILCTVVIVVFALIIAREFGKTVDYVVSVFALPRASTTAIFKSGSNYVLASCTQVRVLVVVLLSANRLVVALLTGYVGAKWLLNTVVLTDLVLNTAAMAFILDLDELVYDCLTPIAVKELVDSLQPLEIRAPPLLGRVGRPLVVLTFTIVCAVWFVVTDVTPLQRKMIDVEEELCMRGNLDFIVEMHPTFGFVIAAPTEPAPPEVDASANTLLRRATDEFVELSVLKDAHTYQVQSEDTGGWQYPDISPKEWPGVVVLNKNELYSMLNSQSGETAQLPACIDLNSEDVELPSSMHMIVESIKLATQFRINDFSASSCVDLNKNNDCISETNPGLRLICSQTCGCGYPRSGLFYGHKGCMSVCFTKRYLDFQWYACEDVSPEVLLSVGSFPAFLRRWSDLCDDANKFIEAVAKYGCHLFAMDNVHLLSSVCGPSSLAVSEALCGAGTSLASTSPEWLEASSIRPWCPVSCGCITFPSADCPQACSKCSGNMTSCPGVDRGTPTCSGGICRGTRIRPERWHTQAVQLADSSQTLTCGGLEKIFNVQQRTGNNSWCGSFRSSEDMPRVMATCCAN